jgi:hypothetical protein
MVAVATSVAWFGVRERVSLLERDVMALDRQLSAIDNKLDWLIRLHVQVTPHDFPNPPPRQDAKDDPE